MAASESKNWAQRVRAWHRDIGFFLIGLTLVYSASGLVLVFRDRDFLNHQAQVEKQLPPALAPDQIGEALRLRGFAVTKTEGETIFFKEGSYRKDTGLAVYAVKEAIYPFNKFIALHKSVSKGAVYFFPLTFAVLLAFMAVSSFWMFNGQSPLFRRGLKLTMSGVILTVILLHI